MKEDKKIAKETDVTFFDKIKRSISGAFYDFTQKIYEKRHKNSEKKVHSMKTARVKELLFYASLVTIPLLHWVVFYLIVHFNSFFLAFKSYSSTDGSVWVGFDNFKRVWSDLTLKNSNLQNAFKNSMIVFGLSLLTEPISIIVPYYIYKKYPGSEFFKVVLYLPRVLSGMVMGLLYQYVVDKILPTVFHNVFHTQIPPLLSDMSTRFWAAWIYGFWFGLGSGMLLYTGAMSRVPVSVVEYAKLDGCGPVRELFSITFPLIFPTFSTLFILSFTGIFTNQLSLYTFFGNGSTGVQTVGYYLYREVMVSSGFDNYPYASALGLFFTLFVAPLTLLLRYVINKIDPDVGY